VGNTGSFAIGITIAAYAVISDLKWNMVVSILPYIFNSAVILLTFFFYRTKANVSFDGKRLVSNHRRSLITIITFNRPLTERQIVILISLLVAATTLAAVFV
jgi:UDP-N-acetylmuramyl pentapeptide phosphotransferase/UDP-N-acetylglucosamine-1-phosphate transferase